MNTYQENLLKAKAIFGSFEKLGNVCGVSGKAVMKWLNNGKPPRTEYSGETRYAEIISDALKGAVKKDDLLPIIKNDFFVSTELTPNNSSNTQYSRRFTDLI